MSLGDDLTSRISRLSVGARGSDGSECGPVIEVDSRVVVNRDRYIVALTYPELVVMRRLTLMARDDRGDAWTKDDLRQIDGILCKLDGAPMLHT